MMNYLLMQILLSPLWQSNTAINRLINGVALLVVLAATIACLLALILFVAAMFPGTTQRGRAAIARTPWQAFFIGLVNYLFFGGISLALFSTEVEFLGLIGLILLSFLIIVTALGLPGLVTLLGERLAAMREHPMSKWQQTIWGALIIEFAVLLPFVGWFILSPILLMLSFGTAILAWRHRKQVTEEWSQGIGM